ncbi:hypothetical protein [Streptomyces sp. 891-h]|uniref:hypothetical protein n=1 Tax=unclassified Streptomyces TaxID=2593676 RepID=UPI001FA9E579|nr:hypothetical protein [Streptomyces sp. 891-h]UNZ21125.1 hypothetical protein HC362_32635 [Streptomyces sp. 891-h]
MALLTAGSVFSFLGQQRDSNSRPEGGAAEESGGSSYHVSLPKTVDGGRLALDEDLSDKPENQNPDLNPGDTQYVAWYASDSGDERYLYVGYNSAAAEDGSSADKMLDGQVDASDTSSPPKRHHITPPGADEPLTCIVIPAPKSGRGAVAATCAWDDTGSAASVSDGGDTAAAATSVKDYDLKAFAEKVDRIRRDVRNPAS